MVVLLANLLIAPPMEPGYCTGKAFDQGEERRVGDMMQSFGVMQINAQYLAKGEREIEDLTPFARWLARRSGRSGTQASPTRAIRLLGRKIEDGRKESKGRLSYWPLDVNVQLGATFSDTARCGFIYLGRISLATVPGSYSGKVIGDWTARAAGSTEAFLVFQSKNALVRLSCDPRVEIEKANQSRRFSGHDRLPERCEKIAREIDARLRRLP